MGSRISLLLIGLLIGLWVGVKAHNQPQVGTFTQFGMSTIIIDTRTGELCDAYPGPAEAFPPCKQILDIVKQYQKELKKDDLSTGNSSASTPLPTQ